MPFFVYFLDQSIRIQWGMDKYKFFKCSWCNSFRLTFLSVLLVQIITGYFEINITCLSTALFFSGANTAIVHFIGLIEDYLNKKIDE